MSSNNMIYVITVSWEVKPEWLDMFMSAMIQQAKDSVKLEQGCTLFHVAADELNPNSLFLYEHYKTKEDFKLHLESNHFKIFSEKTKDWILSKKVSAMHLLHEH